MNVLTVYAHPDPKSFCHSVLDKFSRGLQEAGHRNEVVDLYAIRFDPVFRIEDYAGYVHEGMPAEILDRMNLKQRILDSCKGPVQRFVARRWLAGKDAPSLARMIRSRMPKDVVAQQQKVARAEGLVFIAPVYWCHFPAIMKGWFERVLNYGFAFGLTSVGWQGNVSGRVPMMKHQRALIITPTLFCEEDYERAGLKRAMTTIIDDWGLRYPGIHQVDHVYFYAVNGANSRAYLERAYRLGKEFGAAQ